jgi:hypothetical protein
MKIIATIIVGLGIALALGWTATALASPSQQHSNEAQIAALEARLQALESRLQALEYLRWTENHAIHAVGYKVWERASSCQVQARFTSCYRSDQVLYPFSNQGTYTNYLALNAYHYGTWSASPNGDGDSWNVSVTITIDVEDRSIDYGPFTWTVWESNGHIQAAQ